MRRWKHIAKADKGVVVLLNCGESGGQLLAQFAGTAVAAQAPERGRMDSAHLRHRCTNIAPVRACTKWQLMGSPRRMPSMTGYGLEITGYITK